MDFSANSGGCIPMSTTVFTVKIPSMPNSNNINGIENPILALQRGQTYTFNTGLTGNGIQTVTFTFAVPTSAPGTLLYNCSISAAMTGENAINN